MEIGGWNFKGAQLLSAFVVVIGLSIFFDTYMVGFFTLYRSIIVDLAKIPGLKNKITGLFHKLRKVFGAIYILYMLDIGHLIKKSIGKIRRRH